MKRLLTTNLRAIIILWVFLYSLECTAEHAGQSDEVTAVVVTGTRIPAQKNDAESSVVVVARDDIERINPQSVAQLLQSIPGIHIENTSTRGQVGSVYMRGAEPNYTLVLIDGVGVNDPTNSRGGSFDFSQININSVERIEVVKGSASFVYGSSAMAGVINIITSKKPEGPNAAINIEGAGNGAANFFASASTVGTQSEGSLYMSLENSGKQMERGFYNSRSIGLTGVRDLSLTTELSFNARYYDSRAEVFPDASGGKHFAVIRELDQRDARSQQAALSLKYDESIGGQWQVDLSAARVDEEFWSPGVDTYIPENESDSSYERQNILVSYWFRPATHFRATIGTEIKYEAGGSQGRLDFGAFDVPTQFDLSRNSRAIFAEGKYRVFSNVVWSVGVRADMPDGFDREISPHVGLHYRHDSTEYRLSWGQGFKLPSFFALGHPLVGNSNFGPETSEIYEVYFKRELSSLASFNISVFRNRYFDLIDFGDSGVLVNRDEVVISGVELGVSSELTDKVSINAHYTALAMDIINSSEELNKRPEHIAGVKVDWKMTSRIGVSMVANYVGSINDFSFPTGDQKLEAYTRVDVSARWRISQGLKGYVAVDNILNKQYSETIGSKVTGVLLRVAAQATF